jgi:hypothetical protein
MSSRFPGQHIDRMGVHKHTGQLYWDGQPVVTRRELALSFWQRVGAVLVAAGGAGALASGSMPRSTAAAGLDGGQPAASRDCRHEPIRPASLPLAANVVEQALVRPLWRRTRAGRSLSSRHRRAPLQSAEVGGAACCP